MSSAPRLLLPAILVALSALINAPLALGGAPGNPGAAPQQPPPTSPDVEQLKGIGPAEGWEKCPKCGNLHQKGWICCCPICGACHPKGIKCKPEKSAARRDATCPVCGKSFAGEMPFRRNAQAGCDRDFCTHSIGQGVIDSTIWMCPRCGYANFCPVQPAQGREIPAEFNRKLEAGAAAAVRARVEPLFKKRVAEMAGKHAGVFEELDQSEIPDWLKCEMALEAADARGAAAAMKAKFALEGSYACRRALLSPVNLPSLGMIILAVERAIEARGGVASNPRTVVKAVSEIIAEDAAADANEDKKVRDALPRLSPGEAWFLRLKLAGAYDRLGEKGLALDNLDAAEKAIKELKAEPLQLKPFLALAADHRKFVEKEAEFRARAVVEMRRALLTEDAYPGLEAVPATYLLGELYRRQGDYAKARTWLALAGKLAVKDPVLAGWADEAMGLPGMKTAEPDDAEEAAALAFVEKLTGRKPEFETPKPEAGPSGAEPQRTAAPKSCAECMANIARAYAACVAKTGKAPADLQALVAGGFITAEAAGGFKCPDTGVPYRFRSVKQARSADEMILFHSDPRRAKCKKCLYADGTVKELE